MRRDLSPLAEHVVDELVDRWLDDRAEGELSGSEGESDPGMYAEEEPWFIGTSTDVEL